MNDKLREALRSGKYPCPKCGNLMVFEDDGKTSLVCEKCGHDCALENYGLSEDEIFEREYPNLGISETYEEVYGADDD